MTFKMLPLAVLAFGLAGLGVNLPAQAGTPRVSFNLQGDHVSLDSDGYELDRYRLRRARLALQWKSDRFKGFGAKVEYAFDNSSWTDAYLSLDQGHGRWRLGQYKQPFGLETLTSDRDWLFMESTATDAFALDRRLGIGYDLERGNWHGYLSVFAHQIGADRSGNGIAGRLNWTPLGQGVNLLHLGVAGARDNPPHDSFRLRMRPEVSVGDLRYLDSGSLQNVDGLRRSALEMAWRQGPLLLQGEHLRLRSSAAADDDLQANTSQLSLGWVVTGEVRPYNGGVFGSPSPSRSQGAVELALRWNRSESRRADDQQAMRATGLGINWYLRQHIRLMLDGHRVTTNRFGGQTDASVVQARIQVSL